MDTLALLRSWLRRSRRRRLPPGASHLAKQLTRHVRLQLETLEDRVPPVDLFGFLGGLWDDPFANPFVDPDTGQEEPHAGLTPTMELTLTADPDDPYTFPTFSLPPMGNITLVAGPGWTTDDNGDLVFTAGIDRGEPVIAVPTNPDPADPGIGGGTSSSGSSSGFNPGASPPQLPGGGGPNQPGSPIIPGWASITRVTDSQGREVVGPTNDPNLTVTGIAPTGAEVTVAVDGTAQGIIRADAEGNWSLALPNALSEGAHELTARLDTQPGESINVFVDTTRPQLTLTAPLYSTANNTAVTLEASDNVGLNGPAVIDIDLNRDGDFSDAGEPAFAVVPDGEGTHELLLPTLPPGNYALRARAEDAAGNVGVSTATLVRTPIPFFAPYGSGDETEGPGAVAGGTGAGEGSGGEIAFDSGTDGGKGDSGGSGGSGGSGPARLTTGNETEPNDTPSQANFFNLSFNDPLAISGTVGSGSDVDYFEFTLSGRAGVFFDIDSRETGLSSSLDSALTLFDSNGTQIDQNDNGYDFDTGLPAQNNQPDSSTADSALYRELQSGTYRVRVSSVNNTTGDYTLTINASDNFSSSVPVFESLPGANDTLFLDFDGHSSTNDAWTILKGGSYNALPFDFNSNTSEFSPGEQKAIENIWRVVTEDYSPFNINVTTSYNGPVTDGTAMRMVITGSDASILNQSSNTLGIAFLDSYASSASNSVDDNVAWVFTPNFDQSYGGGSSGQIMATAVEEGNTTSHEGGHTFGLNHYGGNNSVLKALMNTPDQGLNREIWYAGQTTDANNQQPMSQDDMAIISNTTNTFGYRTDDHGDTAATATVLSPSGNVYTASGIISEVATDVDYFRFRATSGGDTMIRADVDDYLNDLNIKLQLFDAAGNVIATDDPGNSFDGAVDATLTDTDYFVVVSSHGDPGEAGQYTLTITTPQNPPPPPQPPGGGGGGGGGGGFGGDIFEPNQTSDQAHSFGTLNIGGSISANNLTIADTPQGLPDYDWFRITAGQTGALTASTTVTSGGTLELHVFLLNGSTPVELVNGQASPGSPANLSVGVVAGRIYLVEVKGHNGALGSQDQGQYNLVLRL